MKKCEIHQLYNLEETIAADIFKGVTYPWEVLPKIKDFIVELGNTLDVSVYEKRGENIWVAKSAKVAETAFLNGPLIIDEGAEVRHCAFIRGNAIVGKNCVVGNSTELKNVILFNSVQVPHYNYVGDSILGHKSHMGAGSITSNVKSDKTLVVVKDGKEEIKTGLKKFGAMLGVSVYEKRGENIWVAKSAKVAETAFLNGPLIIDEGAEVRHCAFIRGNAIVGKNCVVGNSTELKNVILFNSVQVPHYNYVGDSILGHKSHMGAGSITSNVKSDKTLVVVKDGKEEIKTGLKKFGAMLGDYVEVGCNSVLNPGTVIGAHTNVYPLSMVRGVVADHSIYKNRNEVVQKNE